MPAVYEIYVSNDTGNDQGTFLVYKSNRTENKVLSPHLQKGTNKASNLDFTILPGHEYYGYFHKMSTYVRLDRDSETIFYGRVAEIKTDIYKQREITCEGSLTFLKDSILAPNTYMAITTEESGTKKKSKTYKDGQTPEMTPAAFFESLIETHNDQMSGTSNINTRKQFTVGTVSINKPAETFEITSYADISSAISSQLLNRFGGIIRTRYNRLEAKNYIDWIEDYSDNNNQAIEFGVNLLEIDKEKAGEELWTMLLPIGENGVTINGVTHNGLYLPTNPSTDAMVLKYGKIIHYKKFEDAKDASTLLTKATEYLNLHRKDYPDTLTIKAVDLHYLDPNGNQALDIGTLIQVTAPPQGINERRACIEMDLDIQNPENSTYTIGDIMPPDEQGKAGKTSLSSKHSSGSRSAASSFNAVSDRIDGLQDDVNINANNINVSVNNLAVELKGDGTHTGLITATANALRVEYDEKLYGEGGTAQNPTGGIVEEYRSSFTQTAREIDSKVSYTDFNGNAIASRINQTATTILIQAQRINLDGYVTATELSTTDAKITNLINGNTTAREIHANSMDVYQEFYIGSAQNSASFYVNGTQYVGARGITFMGTTKRYLVNSSDYGTAVNWDLAHSHSVSVSGNGTVTIQGAVATNASGRSFRIADTKTYKDGVSAEANTVMNAINVRRSDYDDEEENQHYEVTVESTASTGRVYSKVIEIDATEAYEDGYTVGFVDGSSSGGDTPLPDPDAPTSADDVIVTDDVSIDSYSFFKSTDSYALRVSIPLNNNKTFVKSLSMNATEAYNHGNEVGYSAGKAAATFEITKITIFANGNATVVGKKNGAVFSIDVPATAVDDRH